MSFAGDRDVVDFSRNYALKVIAKLSGELVREREMTEAWWISKHTLAFEPFKNMYPDMQRRKGVAAVDVSVPAGRIEEVYRKYLGLANKYGLEMWGMQVKMERPNRVSPILGLSVLIDDSNLDELEKYTSFLRAISKFAVDLEGTMSGNLGDGEKLVTINQYEHGESLRYMRMVKQVFDPNNILNPGKKFKRIEK